MKNATTYLMLIALLFTNLSCSIDEPIETKEHSISQDDVTKIETSHIYDYIMQSHNAKGNIANRNYENNGANPFWTAEYSNFHTEQGAIVGSLPILGTDMVVIWDYPINGEDRIHVNGEYGHMTWNIRQPKVFIVDFSTGLVVYSNWCEENRTGFFKENISGRIYEEDRSGDGETDVWKIRVNDPESNGIIHIKTTLTNGQNSEPWAWPIQGDCSEATFEANFDLKVWVNNGITSAAVQLDGVSYPRTQLN